MSARTGRAGASLLLVLPFCLALVQCTDSDTRAARDSAAGMRADGASATRVDLTGAGATFPYPLYARWFNDYATRTNVRINYQSIGSGGGIRQMLAGTVDFGATDVPMTDEELLESPTPIVHIPTVLGAVAITYNLPEITRPLKLSGAVIADIFLGRVTRWNDPRLIALNPSVALPASDILVVHRADGSGTSYIMSDYLSAVSTEWASGPGRGKDVRWPAGIGGKGNEGVAGQVKGMLGAIGYLEVVYARQNHLPVAQLQNRVGKFVGPLPFEIASAATAATADSVPSGAGNAVGDAVGNASGSAAADGAMRGPGTPLRRAGERDLRISIVDAPGDHSYPLASFTWMLLSPAAIGEVKTRQLVQFLEWALVDGESMASQLGYVPLPTETANAVLDRLGRLSASSPATVARP